MKNYLSLFALIFSASLLFSGCKSTETVAPSNSNQTQRSSSPSNGIKSYSSVVPKSAQTDEGLFTVHKDGNKVLYEIADSLLGREMLLVSRIAKVPTNFSGFQSAGSKAAEQVITFERQDNSILLKIKSYRSIADENLAIYKSVTANNLEPIIASFPIASLSKDSNGVVIDVSDLFLTDVQAISGLGNRLRQQYQVRRLDDKRSYLVSARSYPQNVEVRHVMTYVAANPPSDSDALTITLEMSQSMVLLPKVPMRKRLEDHRVGWFTINQIDFGLDEQKAAERSFIRRWRLEPKDMDAYLRGELVEPKKQIVYYLDPGTPEKYRKYVKQGVEDWNVAFEAAGFKNAIAAKEPPTAEEDPDWSPEDIRYSTVRWVANTVRNATGPSVSDPRSGEIIESDIIWYHNHLRSYRNRLMIETGAANPDARKLILDDDLIGETVRMVIAHEIGHALGLPHNMQSSSAYPVDSLRSGSFTQKWGIATTIMEYARQNYVAQPGDENIRFIRQLGPYDNYSINWGYRVIPGADTPEEEKPILDSWIMEKAGDPVYRFASSTGYDPSAQTEDLSNDNIKASTYGLANLKRVVPNLIEWTSTDGKGYEDLEEIYGELIGQWSRYARHVATNVGGVYQNRKASNQEGYVYEPVDGDYQKAALKFLLDNAFTTPHWLLDKEILGRIQASGSIDAIKNWQAGLLNAVMNPSTMTRLVEQYEMNPEDAYALTSMLSDLRRGLWSEIYANSSVDAYRRNLQRSYLSAVAQMFETDQTGGRFGVDIQDSDIRANLRFELRELRNQVQRYADRNVNQVSKIHAQDVLVRIDKILDEK